MVLPWALLVFFGFRKLCDHALTLPPHGEDTIRICGLLWGHNSSSTQPAATFVASGKGRGESIP